MRARPSWLDDGALQQFFAATQQAGGEARIVGGAVRDVLLGRVVGDLDAASTLPPEANLALARTLGWKAVPTGIAHGTVTLVLPGGRPLEVTTLRRDVTTDGRRATVAFTDDWAMDAARRDFTINALSMDASGRLYDYCGGEADLAARRLRFIGEPAARIAEDGLRILRYFRFWAVLEAVPDDAALTAIAAARGMVAPLSGERIAAEMRRLLAAPQPMPALVALAACALPPLLTGGDWHMAGLEALLRLEAAHGVAPNPWVRLMALIAPEARPAAVDWVQARWKLSRKEAAVLAFLVTALPPLTPPAQVKYGLRRAPRATVQAWLVLWLSAAPELAQEAAALLALAARWEPPCFPLQAKDLLAHGMTSGPALGVRLRALEDAWEAADYQPTCEDLLRL